MVALGKESIIDGSSTVFSIAEAVAEIALNRGWCKSKEPIHASEDSIVEYIYQSDETRIPKMLENSNCDIYEYGHTHYPYGMAFDDKWIINTLHSEISAEAT